MTKEKRLLSDSIEILRLDIKNLVFMIIEQYKKVIHSIKTRDSQLALEVIKNDGDINKFAEQIDLDTINIIAQYNPVDLDLRRVMTISRLAYELERIADYAKNIAEYVITAKEMNVEKASEYISSFDDMFAIIFKMLEKNLEAFLEEDRNKARDAMLMDTEIDRIYRENFKKLLNQFKLTNYEFEQHMISHALVLNKQIERSGDHLTNISEQILYLVKGKKINYEPPHHLLQKNENTDKQKNGQF
ncbi:MAG: phosphate signaling complex protein PhoU [Bacilli bacterium]|nr:phosphate signaling complex protein PhoU [Bacilli bacterium]